MMNMATSLEVEGTCTHTLLPVHWDNFSHSVIGVQIILLPTHWDVFSLNVVGVEVDIGLLPLQWDSFFMLGLSLKQG